MDKGAWNMADQKEPNIYDHERRILKLEDSQEKIETKLEQMKSAIDISEAKAQERSDMMIKQNNSLMRQNERQATQLESVLSIVTTTKENESKRNAENRMKLWGYFLGGGGIVTLVLQILQNALK